jgi:hypothetical protein
VSGPVEVAHRRLQAIAANERRDPAEDSTSGLIRTRGRGPLKRPARAQLNGGCRKVQSFRATASFQVASEALVPPTVGLRRGGEATRKPGVDDLVPQR